MRLTPTHFPEGQPVEGYGPGFFRVGEKIFEGPLALLPGQVQLWPGGDDFSLFLTHADKFDVLLCGTGAETAPLPARVRTELETAGIGVEIMPTPSACRTYNVLLAEGRRIAAALLPV